MNELKSKVERAGQLQQFKCNFSPITEIVLLFQYSEMFF